MSIDRECWEGTCSRSPIQWNWFHPATPPSWDPLISQVWNCSDRRSRRRRASGGRRKDGKVKLNLGDICCCDQYTATDKHMILFQVSFDMQKKSFYSDLYYIFISLLNILISLSLLQGCYCYGSISRIFNDVEWLIIYINRAGASSASIINMTHQINCGVIINHEITLLTESVEMHI